MWWLSRCILTTLSGAWYSIKCIYRNAVVLTITCPIRKTFHFAIRPNYTALRKRWNTSIRRPTMMWAEFTPFADVCRVVLKRNSIWNRPSLRSAGRIYSNYRMRRSLKTRNLRYNFEIFPAWTLLQTLKYEWKSWIPSKQRLVADGTQTMIIVLWAQQQHHHHCVHDIIIIVVVVVVQ